MIVEPFIFIVNESNIDEYKIIQNILYKNGYCWPNGNNSDYAYFSFLYDCIIFDGSIVYFDYIHAYRSLSIPMITFKEFINRYDIRDQRRKKIERIENEKR